MPTSDQVLTKLSRSKLELMFECPRCFWLYVGQGINRPSSAPYTINNAIDTLLKQEFDEHRIAGTAHPIIQAAGIDAIPFKHQNIDQWRHTFTGIQFDDQANNFHIFGAVDDLWINPQGELLIVDYKSSGNPEGELYDSYKRQMEIYQWLFRQNGFKVSNTAYFVYCRVNYEAGFTQGKLSFDIKLQPYQGNDQWITGALGQARSILAGSMPQPSASCQFCKYHAAVTRHTSQLTLF